ncbi:hypothetical protein ABG067_003330 [Albugo candida]
MTRNSSQTDYNSGVYSIPPTSNWIDTSHPVIKEPGTSKLGPLTAKPQSLKKKKTTIWEEHYPLIQPPNQYHHHRYGYFFHGLFTSDVTCAYRDAVIAFLVLLFSMTIISITGLIFCKEWGIPSQSVHVFVCRLVWLSSPYCASLALRHIAKQRLQACHTPPNWNIPPFRHLFRCYPAHAMLRLSLLSFTIPVLCEVAAFSFTAATRMVNPFNRVFVHKLELIFSFNNVDALDSGLVFYILYICLLGIWWDPLPPSRYDFGLSIGSQSIGCSWLLLAFLEEIGWSGSLFPALEIIFSHSSVLASAITGIIWASWHWPMIIVEAMQVVPNGSGYLVTETRDFHLIYVISSFTLLLVGSRIIMCWIQGYSCCIIWSSVIYHATHKLFIVSVFGQLTAPIQEKLAVFTFFSSEASLSLLVTVWFSTCILSQLFKWTSVMPSIRRLRRRTCSHLALARDYT